MSRKPQQLFKKKRSPLSKKLLLKKQKLRPFQKRSRGRRNQNKKNQLKELFRSIYLKAAGTNLTAFINLRDTVDKIKLTALQRATEDLDTVGFDLLKKYGVRKGGLVKICTRCSIQTNEKPTKYLNQYFEHISLHEGGVFMISHFSHELKITKGKPTLEFWYTIILNGDKIYKVNGLNMLSAFKNDWFSSYKQF